MNSELNATVQLATIAHNVLTALYFTCPPNYACGGPAYAAHASMDSILHLMGIGVPMLQRGPFDSREYQKGVRRQAVGKDSVITGYVEHKSQILSEALRSILFDHRQGQPREEGEVIQKALLQVLQWYFSKAGLDPEKFIARLRDETHDELIQSEPEKKDES